MSTTTLTARAVQLREELGVTTDDYLDPVSHRLGWDYASSRVEAACTTGDSIDMELISMLFFVTIRYEAEQLMPALRALMTSMDITLFDFNTCDDGRPNGFSGNVLDCADRFCTVQGIRTTEILAAFQPENTEKRTRIEELFEKGGLIVIDETVSCIILMLDILDELDREHLT